MIQNNTQTKVFEFIKDSIQRNGISPTYREIMLGVGLHSVATVKYHIDCLRERGLITGDQNKSRMLRIVPPKPATNFDRVKEELTRPGGPLNDPTKMATWLAHVQLSDMRDAAEWLEFLTKKPERRKEQC